MDKTRILNSIQSLILRHKGKIIIASAIALGAIISFVGNFQFLLNFAHDDSFYYLKIANNISLGLGSTFDGITYTNGYHPLWLIVLVVFFTLLKIFNIDNPEMLYRHVFFLHLILSLVLLVVLFKIISLQNSKNDRNKAYANLVVYIFPFIIIRDVGMESIFLCLLLSTFFYLKSIELLKNKKLIIQKIIFVSFIVLCRIDYAMFFLPLLIIGDIIYSNYRYGKVIKIFYIAVPFLVLTVYLIVNKITVGYFFSISSMVVNSFPNVRLLDNLRIFFSKAELFNSLAKFLFLIILNLFALVMIVRLSNNPIKIEKFLLLASLGGVLTILPHIFFNNYGIRQWYLTPPIFMSLILVSLLLQHSNRTISCISLTVGVLIALIVFYKTRIENLKYVTIYNYVKKIEIITPKDARMFTFDWMGITGFFSDRKVITGDGFAADLDYLSALRSGDIRKYIGDKKFDYYSTFLLERIDTCDQKFTDSRNAGLFNVKNMIFFKNDIVLEMKCPYLHSTGPLLGYFYLIKLTDVK